MRNICKLIRMSFYIMALKFYLALPYIAHKTAPHLVEACFRFVQTTVFLLPVSLLCFIINWSQTFINAYQLYFVLVHSFLLSPSSSGKSSGVDHQQGNLSPNKNFSKTKLVGFWKQPLVFQKAFMHLLISSFMSIV